MRAPSRYLTTPHEPDKHRVALDTMRSILVCIQHPDGTSRFRHYAPELPEDHRQLALGALTSLLLARPEPEPSDEELLQPIKGLPRFLKVIDPQPPGRQEFVLATAGPRLYRPHINEQGQLYNLEPVLFCCSGWSAMGTYDNEIGEIYNWFAANWHAR